MKFLQALRLEPSRESSRRQVRATRELESISHRGEEAENEQRPPVYEKVSPRCQKEFFSFFFRVLSFYRAFPFFLMQTRKKKQRLDTVQYARNQLDN